MQLATSNKNHLYLWGKAKNAIVVIIKKTKNSNELKSMQEYFLNFILKIKFVFE